MPPVSHTWSPLADMRRLTIEHLTTYAYSQPVGFGEHRLMVRPLDSHDIRLVDSRIVIRPPARVRWIHDVFGNSVAIVTFDGQSDELTIESRISVDHYGVEGIPIELEPRAASLPMEYLEDERRDLEPLLALHYDDPDGQVAAWVGRFLAGDGRTSTYHCLEAMTRAIKAEFGYSNRFEPGVQTPAETLVKGSGTCRDFALLLMEAARSLGIAARFVSGYLYDPALDSDEPAMSGAGYTHAWAQIYLPGPGWTEFDPTNGIVGGSNLVRVSVARDPAQAIPIQGSYVGPRDAFERLDVEVRVTSSSP